MGIYRKYEGNFNTEITKLSDKSVDINNEISKLEYIINGITDSWKDRTTNDYLEKENTKIEEIKNIEKTSMEEINNLLNNIHNLLDKYKEAIY